MTARLAPPAAAAPPVTPTVRRWYVTSAFVQECVDRRGTVLRPASVAHAKEMGTLTTACGVWADSWRKMLDLPFPMPYGAAPGVETCEVCLVAVGMRR